MSSEKNNEFKAINISVLTISDSRGIEQDDSGADLRGPVHRDQEPSVVTGQDRHPVPTADPLGDQAVGDGVGGVVEFGERHLAEVVDHRDEIERRLA